MNDHWINISFGDEEAHNKLLKSLNNCWLVHKWTVKILNESLTNNLAPVRYKDFRPALNIFIYENNLLKDSQRYSLLRAAEKSFPYFTSKPKFDGKMKLITVDPIMSAEYREIQVQSRQAWIRYLANDRPITTKYGTVFLEGNYKEILREQAAQAGIPVSHYASLLYLIHSVTFKYIKVEKWQIKLNLHPYKEKEVKKNSNAKDKV